MRMKKIKRWFEHDNEDYEISEGNGFLDARNRYSALFDCRAA